MHVEIIRSLLISQDVLPALRWNRLPELVIEPSWHFQIQTREEHLMINVLPERAAFQRTFRSLQRKELSDTRDLKTQRRSNLLVGTLASDDCYTLASFPCQRVHSGYLRRYKAAADHCFQVCVLAMYLEIILNVFTLSRMPIPSFLCLISYIFQKKNCILPNTNNAHS